jgi:hypothetical protein
MAAKLELSRAPALLYNIAQALRLRARPGDCGAALTRYREFITLVEPSPQREIAERYIAELGTCASTNAPAGDLAPTPLHAPMHLPRVSASRDARDDTRVIAVATIAVGGLGMLVTGIALGHHASTLGDEVSNACAVSCDWSAEKSKDAAGHRNSVLGWTLGTIGAVALVGDAAMYYFGVHEHNINVALAGARAPGAVITWRTSW